MAYRMSQKTWVTDISPRVENILGFVEPYRDPYGVRAEWEGVICISDPDETSRLKELVDNSTRFIRMLPWAVPGENDGKGPFEANCFQAPNFTIVHGRWLSSCPTRACFDSCNARFLFQHYPGSCESTSCESPNSMAEDSN